MTTGEIRKICANVHGIQAHVTAKAIDRKRTKDVGYRVDC